MPRDGRSLEALVAYIEDHLKPQGFTVTRNKRVYDEAGDQLAELDVVVEGKVGTGQIAWLIECRDRPSEGPAGVSWIEQLAGRKTSHHFSKVSAVSTTGFSAGAIKIAERHGIDLRQLKQMDPAAFLSWLSIESMKQVIRGVALSEVEAQVDLQRSTAFARRISRSPLGSGRADVFIRCADGARVTADILVTERLKGEGLFEILEPNAAPFHFRREYSFGPGEWEVDTGSGLLPLLRLECAGEAVLIEKDVPITDHAIYEAVGAQDTFAQLASAHHLLPTGDSLNIDFRMLPGGNLHLITNLTRDGVPRDEPSR